MKDVALPYRAFLGFVYAAIVALLFAYLDTSNISEIFKFVFLSIFLFMDFISRTHSWSLLKDRTSQDSKTKRFLGLLSILEFFGLLAFAVVAKDLVNPSPEGDNAALLMLAVFAGITALYNGICIKKETLITVPDCFFTMFFGNVYIHSELWAKWQGKLNQWTQNALESLMSLVKTGGSTDGIPLVNGFLWLLGTFLVYFLRVVLRIYHQFLALHFVVLNGLVGLLLYYRWWGWDIEFSLRWPFLVLLVIVTICYLVHAHQRDHNTQQISSTSKRRIDFVDFIGNLTLLLAIINVYCSLNTEYLVYILLIQQLLIAFMVFFLSARHKNGISHQEELDRVKVPTTGGN